MWTKTGEKQSEIAALLSDWELIVNKTLQCSTFKLKLHFSLLSEKTQRMVAMEYMTIVKNTITLTEVSQIYIVYP